MMKHRHIGISFIILILTLSSLSTISESSHIKQNESHTFSFQSTTAFHPTITPTGDEITITIQAGKKAFYEINGFNITISTTYYRVVYAYINITWWFFDGENATFQTRTPIFGYPFINKFYGGSTVPTKPFIMKLTVQLHPESVLRYGIGGEDFNNHLYMRPYPSKIFKN